MSNSMLTQTEYDYLFKLIVIGDTSVGKSSLLIRYIDHAFPDNFLPTVGVDFKIKSIMLQKKKVKLQIWDTVSHNKFYRLDIKAG